MLQYLFSKELIGLQTAQEATYLQVPYTTIPRGCRLLRQQPTLQVPYTRVVSTRILHSKYFLPIVLKRNCTHSFCKHFALSVDILSLEVCIQGLQTAHAATYLQVPKNPRVVDCLATTYFAGSLYEDYSPRVAHNSTFW